MVLLLPPPRLLTVVVRRIRITWAAPGKSTRAGASTTWTVRRTLRPWEPSGTEMEGTSFQGSLSSSRFRPGRHALDRQEVVGAAGDDPLGGAPPGAPWRRRRRPPHPGPGGEQVGQGGDLVGLIRHSALSHDHSARPARGRQEVGGRVVTGAGPAHGLILHGDHPAAGDGAGAGEEPGGQAGVEARGVQVLQDPPDRGLTGQGPPLLQAQGPQVGRFQVGGVLPYRRQAAASRQYPRHGQGQDRGQGVAHAPPVPGVCHALQDLLQGPARQGGRGR